MTSSSYLGDSETALLGWEPEPSEVLDTCVVLDPEMKRIFQVLEAAAPTPLSVLVLGETGSGKEVAAEWVHRHSAATRGAFLRINCATLAEPIVESELFGHERGAFTGAVHARQGLFEAADGGTLFLDEIGELSPSTQAKLLRVLESGEITRVGSTVARRVDVRIVAATHRHLPSLVAAGRFREDLYFRLDGISVEIPPLRARPTEIVPLAKLFIERVARRVGRSPAVLGERAIARLLVHRWSGNVRELRHVVERAVILARGDVIEAEDLGPFRDLAREQEPAREPPPGAPSGDIRDQMHRFERERILAALEHTRGHQTRAAQVLGISRRTLTNKLNLHAIDRPRKGVTPATGE